MNKLEIVYFINKKTDKIEVLVKEENTSNELKSIIEYLSISSATIKILDNKPNTFLIRHYIDLLKEGYTFESINRLLRDAFNNARSRKFLEPIMEQITALYEAQKNYLEDENTLGLKELLVNPTIQLEIKKTKAKNLAKRNFH